MVTSDLDISLPLAHNGMLPQPPARSVMVMRGGLTYVDNVLGIRKYFRDEIDVCRQCTRRTKDCGSRDRNKSSNGVGLEGEKRAVAGHGPFLAILCCVI